VTVRVIGGPREAIFQSQIQAEPEESGAEVLGLAPPLARLGAQAGGAVDEDDRRLDLVPVLAARSRLPGARGLALGREPVGIERGGVVAALGHAVGSARGWIRLRKTIRSSPSA
jgi:hypothetical protein